MERAANTNFFHRLHGEQITHYVNAISCCLSAIRLNDFYPSFESLLHTVDMMDPEINGGLYPTLKLHQESGLPTYGEFVRVKSDYDLATEELSALSGREERRGENIYRKLVTRKAYLKELKIQPPFAEQTTIKFRKIDTESQSALFRVVLDRFHPSGNLERITVECAQKNRLWGNDVLSTTDTDVAQIRDAVKGTVYRLSPLDAMLMYIRLSDEKDITVTKIVKGTIGPFTSPMYRSVGVNQSLSRAVKTGALLTAGIQIVDIAQPGDVINDPFMDALPLSEEARIQFCEQKNIGLFHGFYDRKFSLVDCDPAALKTLLASTQAKNIIYNAE